jgi:hypothetical protein
MRLFPVMALLLLGADPAPPPEPRWDPVTVDPPAAPVETGAEVLDRAILALAQGHYEEAMQLAVPGITAYPELATSFDAVLRVAADQLARADVIVTPADTPYAYPREYPYGGRVRYPRPSPPPKKLQGRAGVEFGLPTAFRAELHFGGAGLTALGLRAGANVVFYGGGPIIMGDWSTYADFGGPRGSPLQTEVSMGSVWYGPSPYFQLGVAAHYDPPEPWFVNAGGKVTPRGLAPDFTVGFVW